MTSYTVCIRYGRVSAYQPPGGHHTLALANGMYYTGGSDPANWPGARYLDVHFTSAL